MKKILAFTLILALSLSFIGCSLFSDDSIVKLGDDYTHNDPDGLAYDDRIILQGDKFDETLEEIVNSYAYPDTMVYDEDANIVGMYDYDEKTGIASGWTNFSDGSYIAFTEENKLDLGLPDASAMIDIPGTVNTWFVVYGNKGSAVCAYMYVFLSDPAAKDIVTSKMEELYGVTLSAESDTVLVAVQDADFIAAEFTIAEESYGEAIETKDASAYANLLMQYYSVREYTGVSPYEPYAGHTDPEGLEFDERVALVSSSNYAVAEEYEDGFVCLTDYVYANKGEVVAQYSYYEFSSKESADKLMNDNYFTNAVRVSDTVIQVPLEGQAMQDLITSYIGYSVLNDNSLDDYVRMIEESFFSVVCE